MFGQLVSVLFIVINVKEMRMEKLWQKDIVGFINFKGFKNVFTVMKQGRIGGFNEYMGNLL